MKSYSSYPDDINTYNNVRSIMNNLPRKKIKGNLNQFIIIEKLERVSTS